MEDEFHTQRAWPLLGCRAPEVRSRRETLAGGAGNGSSCARRVRFAQKVAILRMSYVAMNFFLMFRRRIRLPVRVSQFWTRIEMRIRMDNVRNFPATPLHRKDGIASRCSIVPTAEGFGSRCAGRGRPGVCQQQSCGKTGFGRHGRDYRQECCPC